MRELNQSDLNCYVRKIDEIKWNLTLNVFEECPYETGIFNILVEFPTDYPS